MKKTVEPRFDPDVRFLLANERTLLAWIRTSIALQAGGIVLAHLGEQKSDPEKLLGICIIMFGAMMAAIGYQRFKQADMAIREARLPSIGYAPLVQVFAIFAVAVTLIIFIIVD